MTSHFPLQTEQDWLTKAAKAARGAAFDGGSVLFQQMGGPRAVRSTHEPWSIFSRVDLPDAVMARAQAGEDTDNGATGLILAAPQAVAAVQDLPLHRIALRNEAGDVAAQDLCRMIGNLPVDPARMVVDFGFAEVGAAKAAAAQGFVGPLMRGDGRGFHAQGCDDATELGAALAQAIAGLRALTFLGDGDLAKSVSLTLSASQDMFSTLAKFRAARILWRDVLAACGLPPAFLQLHAETSSMMMAKADAHMNILRAVTAVFGAGLGGADSICVLPFSSAQGLPNGFARRVARNAQTVLLHEAHLWRVDDPAAGAGAIVALTDAFCDQAWQVMQSCEAGDLPSRGVSAVAPIVGVTMYRPSVELAPDVVAV